MADLELDVRTLRKPDKHPTIFSTYRDLSVGESMVLVNNHDPKHLRTEFDTDHPGSYGWEYLEQGPERWRIRISKLTSTPLPRVLVNTVDIATNLDSASTGAVWKLEARDRDLDSNVISLRPEGTIDAHNGPDLDVLIHVITGTGRLISERGDVMVRPGDIVWLPRLARREFIAGPDGLCYLTIHQRRQSLTLSPSPAQ